MLGRAAPPPPPREPPGAAARERRCARVEVGEPSGSHSSGALLPSSHTEGSYGGRVRSWSLPPRRGWLGPSHDTHLAASRMSWVCPPSSVGTVPSSPPVEKLPQLPVWNVNRLKCSRWPMRSNWFVAPAW